MSPLIYIPLILFIISYASSLIKPYNSNTILKYVFLLHRHGDRAPIYKTSISNDLFNLQWPLGKGQLTSHGMLQLYNLGNDLKNLYIGSNSTYNFLPNNWNSSLIYSRSSPYNRTHQSANSLLYGMYNNQGPFDNLDNTFLPHKYQPIPIYGVLEKSDDTTLLGSDLSQKCPIYQKESNAITSDSSWVNMANAKTTLYTLAQINAFSQPETITFGYDLFSIYDTWYCDQVHGYLAENYPNMPESLLSSTEELIVFIANTQNYFSNELKSLIIGRVVNDFINCFDFTIYGNGTCLSTKFMHYSAHDTTVAPLLIVLGLFDGNMPPYASSILIHLEELDGNYFVSVYYKEEPMVLKFCSNPYQCTYSEFRNYLAEFMITSTDDWMSKCKADVSALKGEVSDTYASFKKAEVLTTTKAEFTIFSANLLSLVVILLFASVIYLLLEINALKSKLSSYAIISNEVGGNANLKST